MLGNHSRANPPKENWVGTHLPHPPFADTEVWNELVAPGERSNLITPCTTPGVKQTLGAICFLVTVVKKYILIWIYRLEDSLGVPCLFFFFWVLLWALEIIWKSIMSQGNFLSFSGRTKEIWCRPTSSIKRTRPWVHLHWEGACNTNEVYGPMVGTWLSLVHT